MPKRTFVALALMLAAVAPAAADGPASLTDADVYASVDANEVVLGNTVVERRWQRNAFVTTAVVDKRPGGRTLGEHADFSLLLDGVAVASDTMTIEDVTLATLPRGGVRVTFSLSLAGLASLERVVEAYPDTAGFSSRTTVTPLIPLVVSGYTLDEVAAGGSLTPTVHAFRSGADWRFDEDWNPVAIGDAHEGDWHVASQAAAGEALNAPGEWLSLAAGDARTVFMVMERHDYASSRMSYDGANASALVDLSRDIVYIGPFEQNAHIENPTPLPARHRVLLPGRSTPLERAFTGFGSDGDDEPWQFYRYLTGHRLTPYEKAITFNTNPVDDNELSNGLSGAKDDVDFDRFLELAEAAREMGVETFIFDDGWQAASGDWCPDSPECPEPRAERLDLDPRFPDSTFSAVRDVLGEDMALGLWMNPMEFNPASAAFQNSPSWTCLPVGLGTAAVNLAQPDDGSNEAGIGVWNPEALGLHPDTGAPMKLIDYIEERTLRMIEEYGARYFKFDFLVWIDCLGIEPVDMYGYRDSFVAMLDRLQAAHPEVTFQIDETNDYRLFPFESVARGPSWFQNGSPEASMLLHNLWNLAPYVPGFSLGQHALGNADEVADPAVGIDPLMAVALGSHITFWTEIDTQLTPDQRAQVKKWTDFYKTYREDLATFTYPLLADPLDGGWTALQPWNPDTGSGFLLAYRQGAANETQSIALRGVRGSGQFSLTLIDPAFGTNDELGTFDAADLRSGFDVSIPDANGYAIIRIVPV